MGLTERHWFEDEDVPENYEWALEDAVHNSRIYKKAKIIVITTMDALPEYCYDCPCHDGEHSTCKADKERRTSIEYRPFWCPLKEIHGYNEMRRGGDECNREKL